MFMSRHQIEGENHSIKIVNRSFENAAKFKYFGTTVTCRNLVHEEIKNILNSGNACYRSVQRLLSSCLVSQNVKRRKFDKEGVHNSSSSPIIIGMIKSTRM
jgi:hypothetical protein